MVGAEGYELMIAADGVRRLGFCGLAGSCSHFEVAHLKPFIRVQWWMIQY